MATRLRRQSLADMHGRLIDWWLPAYANTPATLAQMVEQLIRNQ